MLLLSSPSEVGPLSVEDLVEGTGEGEGEGDMEEEASARLGDQDRGERLQHGLEFAPAKSHVVEGECNQAAGGRGLDGAFGASVNPELHGLSI